MPRKSTRVQTKASKPLIKEEREDVTLPSPSDNNEEGHFFEVPLKQELIIKEEVDDPAETEEATDEFDGYDHLLDAIIITPQHSKIEETESDDGDEDYEEEGVEDEDDDDYSEEDDEDLDNVTSRKSTGQRKQSDPLEFSCFYCDFSCKLQSNFASHLKSHKNVLIHKCDVCSDAFAELKSLRSHQTRKHPSVYGKGKLTCKSCKKTFETRKKLEAHVKNTHKSEKPFKCKHCPKKFSTKGILTRHLEFHEDSRPHECKLCPSKFRTKTAADTHMKMHFNIKEYKCGECGKEFLRNEQLKVHKIAVHENKFPHSCSICNKSIKGHVLTHLRMHMKEKNHKCKECGRGFVQASQLTVHMRVHTGDKPFACEVCNATFSHSITRKHHMYLHTGEKPAKCQLCSAAFTQLAHLKKHMKHIHKSSKPYVCPPCTAFFKTKAELTLHLSAKTCKPSRKK